MMMPKNRKLPVWPTATAFGMMLLAVSMSMAEQADETAAIENAIKDRITVEVKWKNTKRLSEVFAGKLYDVKIRLGQGKGSSYIHEQMLVVGDEVNDVPQPTTNQKMPELLKMLNKQFKLKSQQDAETFEAALDELYPIRFKKETKAIKKVDGKYVFVRGTFFKDLKGFVVTANADGAITDISYSLGIK